jgi:hypothetical protein
VARDIPSVEELCSRMKKTHFAQERDTHEHEQISETSGGCGWTLSSRCGTSAGLRAEQYAESCADSAEGRTLGSTAKSP